MNTDRIDFISSYCDRWCERCAYTSRCAAFATEMAVGMCGDFAQGLQLAIGQSRSALPDEADEQPDWPAGCENIEIREELIAEESRKEKARRARAGETSLMTVAWAVSTLSHRSFMGRVETLRATADPVLGDALDVAQYDAFLIAAKVHRALNGRARALDADDDDDPIQNDWNGSAKVALISIERSEAAWRVIAQAIGEETPLAIADQLRDLRALVDETFPDARAFIRPGFDEPGR